jgi:hypothetical protein
MIRVYAERKGGRCRLFVTGHANEGKDRDAVCAGVSALTEALVLYADAAPACRHLRRSVRAGEVFFSCRGLSADGRMSDPSIDEANLRQVMFSKCKNKYLLCDSSKFDKVYFYDMGDVSQLDDIISDRPLPDTIASQLKSHK